MKIQKIQINDTTTSSVNKQNLDNPKTLSNTRPVKRDQTIISKESLAKFHASLKFNETTEDDPLIKQFQQIYKEYNSAEAIEQRRLEQFEREQAYNRLTDEFILKGVKYHFPENTLHHTIAKALEGKVVNASLYAAELAGAIRSSISKPDRSVEERAAYREMARKQAEYIAENYFDSEEESKAFMNEINKYYENDLLREKGYIVIDNSEIKPFRNYSSPLTDGNEISFYTLVKRYMDESDVEQFINGESTIEKSTKFLTQLKNIRERYSEKIIEEFEINEQEIEKLIADVKLAFESFVWENGRVTGTIGEEPDYFAEVIKWNQDMLNMFHS